MSEFPNCKSLLSSEGNLPKTLTDPQMQVMKKAMSNIQLRDSNLVRNSTGA